MGGKAKSVVKAVKKPSSLAALALGPLGLPIIGGNIAGELAGDALATPDLPEPPEERELETEAAEAGPDVAQKLLRDRRARRRRQTSTILTSPLGANPRPNVSRTTLGGV